MRDFVDILSFTLSIGTLEGLENSVVAASVEALNKIDLLEHKGGHPRKGVVDLIPIHPITEQASLEECGQVAQRISQKLTSMFPSLSVFHFGHADLPLKRDLVTMRKKMGWFNEDPPETKYGFSGIGML